MPNKYLDELRKRMPQLSGVDDSTLTAKILERRPDLAEQLNNSGVQLNSQPIQPPSFPAQPSATSARLFPASPVQRVTNTQALAGLGGDVVETALQTAPWMVPGMGAVDAFVGGAIGNYANNAIKGAAGLKQYPQAQDIYQQGGNPFSQENKDAVQNGVPIQPSVGSAVVAGGINAALRGVDAVQNKAASTAKTAMSEAMNTKFKNFDELKSVRDRALSDGVKFSRNPTVAESEWKKTSALIDKDWQSVNAEVAKMQASGRVADRNQIAERAAKYVAENTPDMSSPSNADKAKTLLGNLKQSYTSKGNTISPLEMQKQKTAVHQSANYDNVDSRVADAWDKAIAHEHRVQLEGWNPSLAKVNQRIFERDAIAESQMSQGLKGAKTSMPSGLPPWLALTSPYRAVEYLGVKEATKGAGFLSGVANKANAIAGSRGVQPDLGGITEKTVGEYLPQRLLTGSRQMPYGTSGAKDRFGNDFPEFRTPTESPDLYRMNNQKLLPPVPSKTVIINRGEDGQFFMGANTIGTDGKPILNMTVTKGTYPEVTQKSTLLTRIKKEYDAYVKLDGELSEPEYIKRRLSKEYGGVTDAEIVESARGLKRAKKNPNEFMPPWGSERP